MPFIRRGHEEGAEVSNGMRWTQEELQSHLSRIHAKGRAALKGHSKRPKYGNTKTIAGDKVFASKGEARRYADLELLQVAGEIRKLQRQVKFDLVVNAIHIGSYTADACYEEKVSLTEHGAYDWRSVTEDFKGAKPREWARTKKLMLACHGIDVREVQ